MSVTLQIFHPKFRGITFLAFGIIIFMYIPGFGCRRQERDFVALWSGGRRRHFLCAKHRTLVVSRSVSSRRMAGVLLQEERGLEVALLPEGMSLIQKKGFGSTERVERHPAREGEG
jgi:hypothetical protein